VVVDASYPCINERAVALFLDGPKPARRVSRNTFLRGAAADESTHTETTSHGGYMIFTAAQSTPTAVAVIAAVSAPSAAASASRREYHRATAG
jgi:hypothetical protein